MSIIGDSFDRTLQKTVESKLREAPVAAPSAQIDADAALVSKLGDVHQLSQNALDFADGKQGMGGYFQTPVKKGFFGKLGGMISRDHASVLNDYLNSIADATQGAADARSKTINQLASAGRQTANDDAAIRQQILALSGIRALSEKEATAPKAVASLLDELGPRTANVSPDLQEAWAKGYLSTAKTVAQSGGDTTSQLMGQLAERGASAPVQERQASIEALTLLGRPGEESPVQVLAQSAAKATEGQAAESEAASLKGYLSVIGQISTGTKSVTGQAIAKVSQDGLAAAGTASAADAVVALRPALTAVSTLGATAPAAAARATLQKLSADALAYGANTSLDQATRRAWIQSHGRVMHLLATGDAAPALLDQLATPAEKASYAEAYTRMSVAQDLLANQAPEQAMGKLAERTVALGEAGQWQEKGPFLNAAADTLDQLAAVGKPDARVPALTDAIRQAVQSGNLEGHERAKSALLAIQTLSTSPGETDKALQALTSKVRGYVSKSSDQIDGPNTWMSGWLGTIQQVAESDPGANRGTIAALAKSARERYASQPTGLLTYEQMNGTLAALDVLANKPEASARGEAVKTLADKMLASTKASNKGIDNESAWMAGYLGPIHVLAQDPAVPQSAAIAKLAEAGSARYAESATGLVTRETLSATMHAVSGLAAGQDLVATNKQLADTIRGYVQNQTNQTLETKSQWMAGWLSPMQTLASTGDGAVNSRVAELAARAREAFAADPQSLATYERLDGTVQAVQGLTAEGGSDRTTIGQLSATMLGYVDKQTNVEWKHRQTWMSSWLQTIAPMAGADTSEAGRAMDAVTRLASGVDAASPGTREAYQHDYTALLALQSLATQSPEEALKLLTDKALAFDQQNTSALDNKLGWERAYVETIQEIANHSSASTAKPIAALATEALQRAESGDQSAYDQLISSLDVMQQFANGHMDPATADSVLQAAQLMAKSRAEKLSRTNAVATVPYNESQLFAIAREGRIQTVDSAHIDLRSITQNTQEQAGQVAFVLSDAGKERLANAENAYRIDQELRQAERGLPAQKADRWNGVEGLNFGVEDALPAEVNLTDVSYALVDAYKYDDFKAAYEKAIADGQVPATINGQPYSSFFRPSEDFHNDLTMESFRRDVPGFAERPLEQQSSTSALAERVATTFPPQVPEPIRRRVADNLVRYMPVQNTQQAQIEAMGEIRTFFHGTRAGDKIVSDGFAIGPNNRYDKGIYYTNPTTSATYALGRSGKSDYTTAAEILSGDVALGTVVKGPNMNITTKYNSRVVPRKEIGFRDTGDYWVTKNPKRLTVKAITRYNPAQAEGFEPLVPDLLKAYAVAPDWALGYLKRIPKEQAKPLYEAQLNSADPEVRASAEALLQKLNG